MSEVMKDCAIKLFGKTISLLPDSITQSECSSSTSTSQDSKDTSGGEFAGSKHDYDFTDNPTEETSSEISDDPNTPAPEKHSSLSTEEELEPSESSESQEKTLKKPDKILPCPRCNSMETKFCYYNNYNVNQPRHFCKNCQRYWTSGGTMRNVPVGSGRRKSKTTVIPNYRHIMISDTRNGIPLSSLKSSGLLIFRHESMTTGSASNLAAERSKIYVPNELYENSSRSIGSSGFPVTFYPATPYWESAVPWVTSSGPSGPNTSPTCSTLGKHSREGTMLRATPSNLGKENQSGDQKSVLTPKTLRFDDPNEAAMSSIWSSLGIKSEKLNGSINGKGIFRTFESSKGDRGSLSSIDNAIMVLQANPAALSRSLNFHESV